VKVRLQSDFTDYYDHAFDNSGQIFNRIDRGRSRLTHQDGLQLLKYLFFLPTPASDYMVRRLAGNRFILFYPSQDPFDLYAQKCLFDVEQGEPPDHTLAVQFIEPSEQATSYRRLQIGQHAFCLKYQSDHPWDSRAGDVRITEADLLLPQIHKYFAPLSAIDFILATDGRSYAINMTTSPRLAGTPIERMMTAQHVAGAIKASILQHLRVSGHFTGVRNLAEPAACRRGGIR
jgi:hypothetical protein